MAFDNEEDDRERGRRADPEKDKDIPDQPTSSAARARGRLGSPGVGNALREAYQEALREEVPPEMLDLLGKLG